MAKAVWYDLGRGSGLERSARPALGVPFPLGLRVFLVRQATAGGLVARCVPWPQGTAWGDRLEDTLCVYS